MAEKINIAEEILKKIPKLRARAENLKENNFLPGSIVEAHAAQVAARQIEEGENAWKIYLKEKGIKTD